MKLFYKKVDCVAKVLKKLRTEKEMEKGYDPMGINGLRKND